MSYILDALKKIEQEKYKKTQPQGRVNISGDLFQERGHSGTNRSFWKLATLIGGVSLVVCAGTWLFITGVGKKSGVSVRPAMPSQPVATVSATVNSVPPAGQLSPPAQTVAVPFQAPPPQKKEVNATSTVSRSNKTKINATTPADRLPHSLPKHQLQLVPAPADIKLSGIAWQDDRSARRAVVNGFLLKEGAVVSGATILEIQTAKVRFMSAAGQFEVALDSVLPAGGAR